MLLLGEALAREGIDALITTGLRRVLDEAPRPSSGLRCAARIREAEDPRRLTARVAAIRKVDE